MSADDILLETLEVIDAATDCGLAEYLGSLLEGSGGNEAVGLEGSSCNTLENLACSRRPCLADSHHCQTLSFEGCILVAHLAGIDNLSCRISLRVSAVDDIVLSVDIIVGVHELPLVHKLLWKELGVARIVDLHLPHHLTDDDFKVLVIDLHTLETVNRLNLIHNVLLSLYRTEDIEDVGR